MRSIQRFCGIGMAVGVLPAVASATLVELRVSVQNLSPANSIAFAPLRVGFNGGVYDSFDLGSTATAPIISIAEGGSGADWFPAFAAADPTATLGTIVPSPAGPLLPGGTASAIFTVDTAVNPYFTFGSMVVPSNDYFIGNDSPTQYRLFSPSGELLIANIMQRASDIWDAGSEVDGAFGAAFIVGSNNDDRIADDGVVEFDFADLSIFDGLQTPAGYVFSSQLRADTPVYRISFEIVPEPASAGLLLLGALGLWRRR